MRPIYVTATGVAVSSPVPLDQYQTPFNVGLGVKVGAGCTCKVQHTFDDPFDPAFNPATATWFDHSSLTGLAANADGNYAFPVRAIRLNQTAGANTSTLVILQAGAGG